MPKFPDFITEFFTPAISFVSSGIKTIFGITSQESKTKSDKISKSSDTISPSSSSTLATELKTAQEKISRAIEEKEQQTPESIVVTESDRVKQAEVRRMKELSDAVLELSQMASKNPIELKPNPHIPTAAPANPSEMPNKQPNEEPPSPNKPKVK